MKKTVLIFFAVLLPFTLWAGGQKDSESSSNVGIEPEKSKGTEDTEDSLLKLAETGDTAGIERLLKVDVNLDEVDQAGRTALHAAAESGNIEIATILILRGAEIDRKDDSGRTALLMAIRNGHSAVVEALTEAGADISLSDMSGNSPASLSLSTAARQIPFLLTSQNIDSQVIDGKPLLHAAALRGLHSSVLAILEEGADIAKKDSAGLTALDNALTGTVNLDKAICASVLLKTGSPPPKDENWKYIVVPMRTGNLETRFDYGSTALHFAAGRGHEGMVQYLLNNGADVNARDQPGNTALHVAVRKGYRRIATLLMDQGSDVNVRDYNGNAPIHESLTANDDYAMAAMLLDRGADPNIKNGQGSTPLHLAVLLMSDVSGARLLVDKGAQIDPRDRTGNTPLLLAIEATDRDLAELFLSEGADIFARNNKGKTPAEGALAFGPEVSGWFFTGPRLTETDNEGRSVLHLAVGMGVNPETLKILLKAGALPDTRDFNGETALHYAVAENRITQAVSLLDFDADPFVENNDGTTPLVRAFSMGSDTTVGILNGRIDIEDRWGSTPLFHAIGWNYPVIVESLLAAGADPRHKNRQGSTALHEAVHTDSYQITSMLLAAGGNPNAGDDLGRTPLHDSVLWDTFEIMKLLADKGAQIDFRDGTGQTALHMAAFAGNDEIVKWLLSSGASVDVRDNNGQTPLFVSAESDRVDTISLLLKNGANLLLRDNDGRTALHSSIAAGRTASSQFLIRSGSDIFAVDGSGDSPFDLAMAGGTAFMASLMDRVMVNKQDNMGNTPLHLAVMADADEEIIRIILDEGADRRARNATGKTPGDIALEMGNTSVASIVM